MRAASESTGAWLEPPQPFARRGHSVYKDRRDPITSRSALMLTVNPSKARTVATALTVALLGLALSLGSSGAQAKGCLKGAAVGAVAGHVAGHHAVLGAAAGCAVGHHLAKKKEREQRGQQQPSRTEAR
jgi:hypothetical protein